MSDIIIALSKQAADDMLRTPVESENSIGRLLGRLDARKVSGDSEPVGDVFYRIADVAPDKIDQLLEELRNTTGIEAAYVKPADELP